MSVADKSEAGHPKQTELALYVTGDLPFSSRVRLRWHLRNCSGCSSDLQDLRHTVTDLERGRDETAIPALDWAALEREMLGNVGVGLAAARCIDKVGTHRGIVWRGALLGSVLALLFVLGWMTHIPRAQDEHLFSSVQHLLAGNRSLRGGTLVRAEAQQLGLGPEGSGLTLLHPPAANTSSYGNSEIEVRYLDEETGQVTILCASAASNYGPQ